MLGAIIGDIVGSPYEVINIHSKREIKPFEGTIRGRCRFTDDSVLCMAVARALIQSGNEQDDMALGDAIASKLQEYPRIYPCKRTILPGISSYGGGFLKWVEQGDIRAVRKAKSNGGAMRAAPIGWLYSSLSETLRVAKIATERTHNSREAIESAQMIAAAVFLARRVKDKNIIRRYGERNFGYTILRGRSGYEQLREESQRYRKEKIRKLELKRFVNCGAKHSVETALFAFLNTEDYEDCIRTAIAVGGDSDTIACMAGGIAEAFYGGVPAEWKYRAGGILAECGCKPDDLDMVMNFERYAASITDGWENGIPESDRVLFGVDG